MMATEIIVAIISLVGVVVSAITSLALVNWRLGKLEDKMDKVDEKLETHNQYAVKFAELSGDIKAIRIEVENLKSKE